MTTTSMICVMAGFFQAQLNAPVTVQATPAQIGQMAEYSLSECKKEQEKSKKKEKESKIEDSKDSAK